MCLLYHNVTCDVLVQNETDSGGIEMEPLEVAGVACAAGAASCALGLGVAGFIKKKNIRKRYIYTYLLYRS